MGINSNFSRPFLGGFEEQPPLLGIKIYMTEVVFRHYFSNHTILQAVIYDLVENTVCRL
jgi:hypothetical protein